ncbi:BMP and activin membrane-bound inhibitor homolog isoform X1 [Gallus gallus]|uniref:BMP and activin membrane-bound inhibitor homolog isoform X1 n=1 Tax=Gallus gallus TaxID=9031 RepID=UPI001EFFC0B2|nr:BMP and activin membrane-bound inhibitor homolog isoform X1 [Gallus gallus]
MCPIPSGVGTVGALSPLSAVPRAPLGEQPCAARHCPALPPPGGAAGGLAVRAQGRRRRPCPRRSPPASRRRRGAANGAARGACRPGPAPPVFTGREAPPPCQRSAPAVPPLRPQPGTGPQPQRWPRDGCARGRAAPRWRLWRAARPCLRGGLWRAGKWIAIPATSSSGCNWSCAPWPSCSPEVKSDATVMPHTVLRPAICANPSLAPASPDCLILRIHIPHLLMAAWTLLQAQLISAKPNRHKTTLAPPCPHWNAVMKICAITEDCTMFCLLPRDKGADINMTARILSPRYRN